MEKRAGRCAARGPGADAPGSPNASNGRLGGPAHAPPRRLDFPSLSSRHGSIEAAVEAMKEGAYDSFQTFRLGHLDIVVRKALERRRLVESNRLLRTLWTPAPQRSSATANLCARPSRWRAKLPPPTRPCCSSARAGPARKCLPTPSTLERSPREAACSCELRGLVGASAGKRALRP